MYDVYLTDCCTLTLQLYVGEHFLAVTWCEQQLVFFIFYHVLFGALTIKLLVLYLR